MACFPSSRRFFVFSTHLCESAASPHQAGNSSISENRERKKLIQHLQSMWSDATVDGKRKMSIRSSERVAARRSCLNNGLLVCCTPASQPACNQRTRKHMSRVVREALVATGNGYVFLEPQATVLPERMETIHMPCASRHK